MDTCSQCAALAALWLQSRLCRANPTVARGGSRMNERAAGPSASRTPLLPSMRLGALPRASLRRRRSAAPRLRCR